MPFTTRTFKITIAGGLLFAGLAALQQPVERLTAHVTLTVIAMAVLALGLTLQQFLTDDSLKHPVEVAPPQPLRKADRNQILLNLGPDLRAPVKQIVDIADTIMLSNLTWSQRKNVADIRASAEDLDGALSSALDFAAINSGRLKLRSEPFSLRESLQELLAPFTQRARNQKRQFRHLVQTRVPEGLRGDIGRLGAVIENLLERAGGDASLHSPRSANCWRSLDLRVSLAERNGDLVRLRFRFTGGSLPADVSHLRRLMEMSDGSSGIEHESVDDLAFALTLEMVRLLGGELTISDEDTNPRLEFTTEFQVSGMVSQPTTQRSVMGLIPDLPVLLVHPEGAAREQLEDMLIRWQTEPTSANSIEQAWQLMDKQRRYGDSYGLVIVADGFGKEAAAFCGALRTHALHSAVPRIFLHAAESDSSPDMPRAATVLKGPVKSSELARAILSSVLGFGRYKEMRKGISAAEMYVRSLIPPPAEAPIPIDWRYLPAADLAGDALGFQWIDDENCALYIVDVNGHGIDASLLSVTVLNVLKTMSLPETDFCRPGEVVTQLNARFPMESQGHRCFTAWYGVYNRTENRLCWSAGGHPPGLLLSTSGEVTQMKSSGPMLGMMDDFQFEEACIDVSDGDRLLLYTDGAFELRTPGGQMGTFDEFVAFVSEQSSSDTLLDDLWQRARLVCENDMLEDDFTLLTAAF